MKTKIFACFFIVILLLSTVCFATPNITNAETTVEDVIKTPSVLDYDLFIGESDYTLTDEVSGNVFTASTNFTLSSMSSINGNLYAVSENVTLKSDVIYSTTEKSKDGNYKIDNITSSSIINGNVFVISKDFTLEPGTEINGDLYIVSERINIDKSSSIYGSIFAVGEEIIINGKVSGSVYAVSNKFDMSYFGSISKDLNLDAEYINLDSVIHRNANISCSDFTTSENFLIYGNLEVDSLNTMLAGEVDGNAKINSTAFNINLEEKTLIKGNLDYSSINQVDIPEGIVSGEVTYSEYVQKEDDTDVSFAESFKSFIIELIGFVAFVVVVCLLIKIIMPGYYEKAPKEINVGNIAASFGVGFLSMFVVIFLFIILLSTSIGVRLSFALLFAYAFLFVIGTPTLVLDIAKLLKEKLNIYALIVLIPTALCLVSVVPLIGGLIRFVFLFTGIGRIMLNMIKK